MDAKLLEILVCPVTKGPLVYDRERQELVSGAPGSRTDPRRHPGAARDEARKLTPEEVEAMHKAD